jgi:hypothetical protein
MPAEADWRVLRASVMRSCGAGARGRSGLRLTFGLGGCELPGAHLIELAMRVGLRIRGRRSTRRCVRLLM